MTPPFASNRHAGYGVEAVIMVDRLDWACRRFPQFPDSIECRALLIGFRFFELDLSRPRAIAFIFLSLKHPSVRYPVQREVSFPSRGRSGNVRFSYGYSTGIGPFRDRFASRLTSVLR